MYPTFLRKWKAWPCVFLCWSGLWCIYSAQKLLKQKHVKINIFKKSDLNISDPQFSKYQSIVYNIHKILFLFHKINMYVKCIERIDTNRSREKVPTHSWIIVIGLFQSWWTIMTRGRSGRFQHLSCLQKSTDKSLYTSPLLICQWIFIIPIKTHTNMKKYI